MKRRRCLATGCLTLAVTAASLLSAPFASAATRAPADATTALPSPDTVFQDWNNAFLVQNGSGSYGGYGTKGTYYTDQLKSIGNQRAGTWIAGYDVAGAEDMYERTHSPADWTLVNNLVTTEVADDGSNWASYDTWNDDLGWMINAVLRGYQITGNRTWLTIAETQWHDVWNRGWTPQNGGGIWENMTPEFSKCTLSNEPEVFNGVSLYRITGDKTYLTTAETVYNWVYTHLVNPTTGQVNECVAYPNGPNGSGSYVQTSDNAYNGGLLIEAADSLYRATGNKQYYDEAVRTADHFLSTYPVVSNGGGRGTSYQYWLFKGIDDLCTDTGTCAKYAAYMHANAVQAWSERNSAGLTWNNWSSPTNDANPDAYEMESMVTLFQDFPVTGASPFTKSYNFKNAATGKLVTVKHDATARRAPVVLGTSTTDASAAWRLVPRSNGYYEIKNARSGQLVNVKAASGAPGRRIVQWPTQGLRRGNDLWLPIHNANGTWSFYNRNSQLALSLGTSTATGAQLCQEPQDNTAAQQFTLIAR